jgi:outer membrane protein OmpA-like peptidoglycan-associated protein
MQQTTPLSYVISFLGVLALVSMHSVTLAQDYRLYGSDDLPSADQLIDSLNPDSPTRGLRVLPKGERAATEPVSAAVSLQINFEFNSYNLTPNATRQLDALGQALQSSELGQDSFLIEGHTDSVGAEQYNLSLSDYRAREVKRYLVKSAGVDARRLKTEGRGELVLLDEQNPTSGKNRRVQIVNMRPIE